ncbi:hypothetical protein [Verrucomicrobium sp. BvORR106]|uniref:hypothetical protein n=1 Tax=Verrucomicrobium sp. BvORR106 TaxID=1403819 RepID=UPI000A847439|nr:hypothetical protein [Verrucomicrobium sp. BvORR106]
MMALIPLGDIRLVKDKLMTEHANSVAGLSWRESDQLIYAGRRIYGAKITGI